MRPLIGIEVGHRRTAFCVAVPDWRENEPPHFQVRFLERLPPRTPYPKVAERWARILGSLPEESDSPTTLLNITTVGMPVYDLIRRAADVWLQPVQILPGAQPPEERDRILTVGKTFLVSRLQVLLQTHRLHLPKTPDARVLAEELQSFEIQAPKGAVAGEDIVKVGSQDDCVTALGLAVHSDPAWPWTSEELAASDSLYDPYGACEVDAVLSRLSGHPM